MSLKNKLSDLYYALKLYKVKDLYHTIKVIPRKIIQVIKWIPVTYRFELWDYGYILDVWDFALNEQLKFYKTPGDAFSATKHRNASIKLLQEMSEILNRIHSNSYLSKEYEEVILNGTETVHVKQENGLITFTESNPKLSAKKLSLMKKLINKEQKLKAKDLKRFGELFQSIERIWD